MSSGSNVIDGQILRVTIPAQSSTNTYDITLQDDDGIDILYGKGSGLADSITDIHAGTNLVAVSGFLRVAVTNSTADATNGSANA